MIVKIGFNPEILKPDEEASPAFACGGMTLKLWALYKRKFITNQHFRESLVKFADYIRCANSKEPEDSGTTWYKDIHEFMAVLQTVGIIRGGSLHSHNEIVKWVIEHWDYFNPNIQKAITIEYEVTRPVTEQMVVGGIKHDG